MQQRAEPETLLLFFIWLVSGIIQNNLNKIKILDNILMAMLFSDKEKMCATLVTEGVKLCK